MHAISWLVFFSIYEKKSIHIFFDIQIMMFHLSVFLFMSNYHIVLGFFNKGSYWKKAFYLAIFEPY